MMATALLKLALPLACSWVRRQEARILREGVPLTEIQSDDARRIGIQHLQRVRLLAIDQIPVPVHPVLQDAARRTGLVSPHTAGLTLGYGIYLRRDALGRRLVVHELAHVAQYERLGGIRPFLNLYLRECIDPGYPLGPLEQEALRIERQICGRRPPNGPLA